MGVSQAGGGLWVRQHEDGEQGVVADGSLCHGLCGAQPAPSRPAAKRYVMRKKRDRIRE